MLVLVLVLSMSIVFSFSFSFKFDDGLRFSMSVFLFHSITDLLWSLDWIGIRLDQKLSHMVSDSKLWW